MKMIEGIRKKIEESREKKRKKEEEQKICKHNYKKIDITIRGKAHTSLLTMIAGEAKEIEVKTWIYKCLKCEKEITPDIDTDVW